MYRQFLRFPNFRGKAKIDGFIKRRIGSRIFPVRHGMLMSLDALEWTQAALIAHGCIEPLTIARMESILRPSDTYVDVGAHVGFHTLMARRLVGDSGRVIAVEPQPYNCERILTNWQLNGLANIEVHVAAAGAEAGSVRLAAQRPTDKARLSLALEGVNDLPQHFHVPLVRVADLADGPIRLLKIDAEGYEAQVLAGADLPRVENVILEALPDADAKPLELLRAHGFTLRTVTGEDLRESLPESNVWAIRA